ncbi:hypothetical protein [Streptomyces sp. NPDC045470]|uniref:hypothetical protein n=1 Tax=Streptomyces sp. NPDC045470 TaxID=3155469 RepID=UPI0033F8A3AB
MERTGARPWTPSGAPLRAVRAAVATALERLLRAVPRFAFRPLRLAAAVAAAGPGPEHRRARPVRQLPLPRPLPRLGHCVVRRGPPLPGPCAAY